MVIFLALPRRIIVRKLYRHDAQREGRVILEILQV
jgi:hypothetical protein